MGRSLAMFVMGKPSLSPWRVGTPYSPVTGEPIEAQQVSDMVDRTLKIPFETRGYLLAPIVRDRKGEYRKEFIELRKKGFQRIKVDGEFYDSQFINTYLKKQLWN